MYGNFKEYMLHLILSKDGLDCECLTGYFAQQVSFSRKACPVNEVCANLFTSTVSLRSLARNLQARIPGAWKGLQTNHPARSPMHRGCLIRKATDVPDGPVLQGLLS